MAHVDAHYEYREGESAYPVFRPTLEQFRNFPRFLAWIERHEPRFRELGVCKVSDPPPGDPSPHARARSRAVANRSKTRVEVAAIGAGVDVLSSGGDERASEEPRADSAASTPTFLRAPLSPPALPRPRSSPLLAGRV